MRCPLGLCAGIEASIFVKMGGPSVLRADSCRALARKLTVIVVFLTMVGAARPGVGSAQVTSFAPGSTAEVTYRYVVHFYPRWFTFNQERLTATNELVGPNRMTPIYKDVVAPNDDTIYVSSFVDVTAQPIVLFLPPTTIHYDLLVLDPYGSVYSNLAVQPSTLGGVYALTGPDFNGTIPLGVTQVPLPLNLTQWIIRADKYSPDGNDQTAGALEFRDALKLGTLSQYEADPTTLPKATIVPVELASIPFKQTADRLCS